MKRIKVLLLLIMVGILCGCSSKFEGTWCRFSDVPSTLIILNNDIDDESINNITAYIKTIPNLKSYDIIDKIEDSSKMITVYYKDEEGIDNYENEIKAFSNVARTKSTKLNQVVDKLTINNGKFVYDKDLNDLSAKEEKGSYKEDNNTLILDNNINFYFKDKFLCYDKECSMLLTKAKGSECQ